MVGITTQNEINQNDKSIGISFRRKDQLSGDVIWSVLEKVAQSNARFNALDRLVETAHSVKMPIGFGRVKSKGRPISVMAHLKRSIVDVKDEENCLAHALIIAISRVNKDPKYESIARDTRYVPWFRTCSKRPVSIWIEGVGSENSRSFRNTSKNTELSSFRV